MSDSATNRPSFSVVIPTRDMCADLELLLKSLHDSGISKIAADIIVVDDGSNDGTSAIVAKLRENSEWSKILKLVRLEKSEGRFQARLKGALVTTGDLIFFLDTRIQLPPKFGASLQNLLVQHQSLMGVPDINAGKSIYNLYWHRTHHVFFHKHFHDARKGFYLNAENFERYTKGTGALLLRKAKFLEICKGISAEQAKYSDDTFLLQNYVREYPVFVTTECSFTWEPRQSFSPFMGRLFERGQNFAYNHWLTERTRFTAISIGALILAAALFAIFVFRNSLLEAIVLMLLVFAGSVVLFTRSPKEIVRLAPLHTLCLLVFGVGSFFAVAKSWIQPEPKGHDAIPS